MAKLKGVEDSKSSPNAKDNDSSRNRDRDSYRDRDRDSKNQEKWML